MLRKLMTVLILCTSISAAASEKTKLDLVVASQQAKLQSQEVELQKLNTKLDQLTSRADKQDQSLNETRNVANAARERAEVGIAKFFMPQTGGGRSCRSTCNSEGSSYCVVAWAGTAPFETWTCDANPAGNLICLCAR